MTVAREVPWTARVPNPITPQSGTANTWNNIAAQYVGTATSAPSAHSFVSVLAQVDFAEATTLMDRASDGALRSMSLDLVQGAIRASQDHGWEALAADILDWLATLEVGASGLGPGSLEARERIRDGQGSTLEELLADLEEAE